MIYLFPATMKHEYLKSHVHHMLLACKEGVVIATQLMPRDMIEQVFTQEKEKNQVQVVVNKYLSQAEVMVTYYQV